MLTGIVRFPLIKIEICPIVGGRGGGGVDLQLNCLLLFSSKHKWVFLVLWGFYWLTFSAFVFRRRFQAEGLFEGRRDPLTLPAPQRLAAPPRAEADRGGRRQPGEGEATLSARCFRPVGKSRPIY